MSIVRVAVRDRRRLVREGLCLLLNDESDVYAHELVDFGEADSIDVVLVGENVDIDMTCPSGARVVAFHDSSTIDEIVSAVCADTRPPTVEASPFEGPASP